MAQDDIGKLIPEIYYDLIARVSAGVPLVMILVMSLPQSTTLDFQSLLMILGLAFIVGHLLGGISVVLNMAVWQPRVIACVHKRVSLRCDLPKGGALNIFSGLYERVDVISAKDQSGGAILKKMEAGAALSDSLFSGWLVLWGLYFLGVPVGWALFVEDSPNPEFPVLIGLILLLSMFTRRVIFIARQDSIWANGGYTAPNLDPTKAQA